MKNRKGTEWTIWKLVSLVMLVLVLALVIYGISTGAFSPLIKKVEAAYNSVLGLIKPTTPSENPDLIRKKVINGVNVKILLDDGDGRCIIKEILEGDKSSDLKNYGVRAALEKRDEARNWKVVPQSQIATAAQEAAAKEVDELLAKKKKLFEGIKKETNAESIRQEKTQISIIIKEDNNIRTVVYKDEAGSDPEFYQKIKVIFILNDFLFKDSEVDGNVWVLFTSQLENYGVVGNPTAANPNDYLFYTWGGVGRWKKIPDDDEHKYLYYKSVWDKMKLNKRINDDLMKACYGG